jgi:hypothetical protein
VAFCAVKDTILRGVCVLSVRTCVGSSRKRVHVQVHSTQTPHSIIPFTAQNATCCNTRSNAPDDGRKRPRHVELKEHKQDYLVASSWFFLLNIGFKYNMDGKNNSQISPGYVRDVPNCSQSGASFVARTTQTLR